MEPDRNSSRSKRPTGRIFAGLVFLVGIGLGAVWWRLVKEDPIPRRPAVAIPNPNAHDFYVAAARARVGAKQIDTVMKAPTAPKNPQEEQALQQLEAAIRKEGRAFQLMHQGFAYDYRNPSSVSSNFTDFTLFRSLARLVAMQSRVRAARGDWGGAMESALDAVRLGEDIPHGSALMGELVGIACQSIGQRPAWESLDHLSAAQARGDARRLEAILERHSSFAEIMEDERWFELDELQKMFRKITVRNALTAVNDLGYDQSPPAERYRMALQLLYGKKQIMHDCLTYMDQMIALGRQPYGRHPSPPSMPTDPVNQMVLPLYADGRVKMADSEAVNRLLLVALALRAFRMEHGRPANSLTELTPTYLKQLPDDPFAAQGTFQYHLKGSDFVLYSVGPDGKDDGGVATDDPQQASASSGRQGYRVNRDSKGDIVAGINYP